MGNALTGSWMWADSGLISRGLAKRNPLRWSMILKIDSVINDLAGYKSSSSKRPVKVVLYEGFPNPLNVKKELQLTFLSLDQALEVLQEYCSGASSEGRVSSDASKRSFSGASSSGETENVLWESFRARLADQVAVLAKWNRDANTLWCEKWSTLEQALEALNSVLKEGKAEAEQPITLNVKVTMKQGSVFRYFAEVPTAEAAQALFQEVSTAMAIPDYTVVENSNEQPGGYVLDLTELAGVRDLQQDEQPTWVPDADVPTYGGSEAPPWKFDSRKWDTDEGTSMPDFTIDSRGTPPADGGGYAMDLGDFRPE